jgi:nucleotide-binding universal stress UspA family protein
MTSRFTHILVPTDFGPASDAALACAKEMASRFHARLSLLHVITDPLATGVSTPDVYVATSPELRDKLLANARERMEAAVTEENRPGFAVSVEARIGTPAAVIEDFVREQKVDLIVMGTHGRRGLSHLFLGSVAERLVRLAPCPVLTTHAEGHPRGASVPAA